MDLRERCIEAGRDAMGRNDGWRWWAPRHLARLFDLWEPMIRERDDMKWEWTLVIDGDPRMDGTHERREVGRFGTEDEARRGYKTITGTMRLPADEVRIERRQVGPWEVVE
jgi:hypothetical protein